MSSSTESPQTRTRQACEPCRKKKVKCNGERPVCAFCRRLNQRCSYGGRHDRSASINKDYHEQSSDRSSSRERLHVLENHVEQIFDLLHNIKETIPQTTRTQDANNFVDDRALSSPRVQSLVNDDVAVTMPSPHPSFWTRIHGLDRNVIHKAVQVYAEKMHCQPLPLLETADLEARSTEWPKHLLLNFLVATTRFSSDVLPAWTAQDRQRSHKMAASELMTKATESEDCLGVLQSLCFLVLEEIAEGQKIAAWVHIGIGARLAFAANQSAPSNRTEGWARACWSLYVLDRTYGASFSMTPAFPNEVGFPNCPPSHPIPQVRGVSTSSDAHQARQSPAPEGDARTDIDASCFLMLSIWDHTMRFLQKIRANEPFIMWSEDSQYQKLWARFYDFEIAIGRVHRVKNVRPDARSAAELESERGYWAPWLTMHLLYHSVQVLINHPFLHLAKKQKDQAARPPSFLQRTVDQMLLHSGWVTRLLNLFDEKEFTIHDPFVAHLASVVATSFIVFLNANDASLAQQANQGFDTCYNFIKRFVPTWPHVRNTIRKLDILKTSISNQSAVNSTTTAPLVQASLLWSLFDYSSSTTLTPLLDMSSSTVEFSTTTQFLSPIESVTTPQARQGSIAEMVQAEPTGIDPNIPNSTESIFENDISLFDPILLADIHTSNFGDDFYGDFGQL